MTVLVSVTCANQAEAKKIASLVLEKKLAACANWWPVESIYWWHNQIVYQREIMLELKTTAKSLAAVKRLIAENHSYQIPVISVGKVTSSPAATRWLKSVIK